MQRCFVVSGSASWKRITNTLVIITKCTWKKRMPSCKLKIVKQNEWHELYWTMIINWSHTSRKIVSILYSCISVCKTTFILFLQRNCYSENILFSTITFIYVNTYVKKHFAFFFLPADILIPLVEFLNRLTSCRRR